MKFPSVQQILQDAARTFLRFPFVLTNAAAGTIVAVILIDHEGPPQPTVLFNILFAAILGIPLLTGFTLFSERQKWGRLKIFGLQIFGILLLAGYGWTVPADLMNAPAVYLLRMLLIALGLHLFVSYAPFYSPGELNAFWQYNKILFLRLISTGIYAAVIYSGLALALAALDNLFGINMPEKRYGELWVVILGVFATWVFLAGIPRNFKELEDLTDYPKAIKVFAQYILFPLVIVYLVILYAYLAKILIDWDWPQGWVGRLILGFATTGIFSLLLLHPVRNLAGNVWIKTAYRWFFVVMIPLVVMLLLALWRRISEYGFTEGRYLGAALGIWLGGMVVYFIFSRTRSIKAIPVSLSVCTLVISFGPWSAFSVSEKSQTERLRNLLSNNSILIDDQIQKTTVPVPQQDVRQISSVLAYLHEIHGYDRIQPWFRESLRDDSTGSRIKPKEPARVAKMIGIEYVNVRYRDNTDNIWLSSNQSAGIDLKGYDRMVRNVRFSINKEINSYSDQELFCRATSKIDTLLIGAVVDEMKNDTLHIDLKQLFGQLVTDYDSAGVDNIAPGKMMLQAGNTSINVKICFRYINLRREGNLMKPAAYGFDLLYKNAAD